MEHKKIIDTFEMYQDPGPFFYIYITFYHKHRLLFASIIYLLTANKYHIPHDTFNPLFSANQ
jgi:hypothetical protein